MWQNQNNVPSALGLSADGTTGYASVNGKDIVYYAQGSNGNNNYADNGLWTYDPSQNTWQQVGSVLSTKAEAFSVQGAGAFDSKDNIYVRTGTVRQADGSDRYELMDWSLTKPGPNNYWTEIVLPGSALESNGYIMGMDWDPTLDLFFLWDGNGAVWSLDPSHWALKLLATTGSSPSEDMVDLARFNDGFTGVLGDWHYLSGLGVFAGVTDNWTNGVFTPEVWLFNPRFAQQRTNLNAASSVLNAASSVDPAPEPGALGILLVGAGFALTRRHWRLRNR
jgi:hypothetical protein